MIEGPGHEELQRKHVLGVVGQQRLEDLRLARLR